MGSSVSPVKSSTEHPASPAAAASRTVSATPAGSSAKPDSRSAVTGRSVAWTIQAACSKAWSRVTCPSARPRVAANPLLVVASAWKPREASSTAEPRSHGLGRSSGRRSWCRSRNRLAFSTWSVIAGPPWRRLVTVREVCQSLPTSPAPAGPGRVDSGRPMKDAIAIEPFTIAVDEAVLTDLCDRIRRTSWPDHPAGAGWESGTDPGYLRSLLATWADEFDWRSREQELNRLPHNRAQIDGQAVHFIHALGDGPAPLPIVLTHGFPSSFVEHLELLPLLTDPAANGGQAEDAFDVVVTSLPGYGFSDPSAGPMLEAATAD